MTLNMIIQQALRQLDEDPDDVSEYFELFRTYANIAYQIITRDYYKPTRHLTMSFDEEGLWRIPPIVERVIELTDEDRQRVVFFPTTDGEAIQTSFPGRYEGKSIDALCEVRLPPMEIETDEPKLPFMGVQAIVDYICYRHLMNGNLAKQSRAQGYQKSFYEACNKVSPNGFGTVRNFRNLYSATNL